MPRSRDANLDNTNSANQEVRKDKDMQSENMQSNEGNQKNPEAWMEVCELASREQKPGKADGVDEPAYPIAGREKDAPSQSVRWLSSL